MNKTNLKSLILECYKEIQREQLNESKKVSELKKKLKLILGKKLKEMTGTSAVASYQTPFAFSGAKKRKQKYSEASSKPLNFKGTVDRLINGIKNGLDYGEIKNEDDVIQYLFGYAESFGLNNNDPVINAAWEWYKENEKKNIKEQYQPGEETFYKDAKDSEDMANDVSKDLEAVKNAGLQNEYDRLMNGIFNLPIQEFDRRALAIQKVVEKAYQIISARKNEEKPLAETSTTGGIAGYQIPGWGSKSKRGSERAISASKSLGYVPVKNI